MSLPPFDQAPNISALPTIQHGFFGRLGAAGDTHFNMSQTLGADPASAIKNRQMACNAIGATNTTPASVKQTHSADVITISRAEDATKLAEADGIVTALSRITLSILTADCVPVLFADAEAGVIGACHAGWRGAVDGIIANIVAAMTKLDAKPANIIAAIGPAISGANYEVGPEFAADVIAIDPDAIAFISNPNGEREHFNLPGFVAQKLIRAGITNPQFAGGCTFAEPARYFSHRRTVQTAAKAGRQIALIARR